MAHADMRWRLASAHVVPAVLQGEPLTSSGVCHERHDVWLDDVACSAAIAKVDRSGVPVARRAALLADFAENVVEGVVLLIDDDDVPDG